MNFDSATHRGLVDGFSAGLVANIALELQARREGAAKYAVCLWLCARPKRRYLVDSQREVALEPK